MKQPGYSRRNVITPGIGLALIGLGLTGCSKSAAPDASQGSAAAPKEAPANVMTPDQKLQQNIQKSQQSGQAGATGGSQ